MGSIWPRRVFYCHPVLSHTPSQTSQSPPATQTASSVLLLEYTTMETSLGDTTLALDLKFRFLHAAYISPGVRAVIDWVVQGSYLHIHISYFPSGLLQLTGCNPKTDAHALTFKAKWWTLLQRDLYHNTF